MGSNKNGETPEIVSEKDVIDFVHERFNDLKKSCKKKDLVNFHTINKYLLMVHNQKEKAVLGNLVANRDKKSLKEILSEYQSHLKIALSSKPTIKTNYNALMHIMGFFRKHLSKNEKDFFCHLIERYRNEKITLGKTLAQIEPLIHKFNKTYLASQTYFLLYANTRPGNIIGIMASNKT